MTSKVQTHAAADTTTSRNWAEYIRTEFEAVGFTVTGLRDDLTRDQGIAFLEELTQQMAEARA